MHLQYKSLAWLLSTSLFLLLAMMPFSNASAQVNKLLLLQKISDKQHEMYYYPWQDSLFFSMTMRENQTNIISIEETPDKQKQKSYLEDVLGLFRNYFKVSPDKSSGRKYHQLIDSIRNFGDRSITIRFDDLIISYVAEPNLTIDLVYLRNMLSQENATQPILETLPAIETNQQQEEDSTATVPPTKTAASYPVWAGILLALTFVISCGILYFVFKTSMARRISSGHIRARNSELQHLTSSIEDVKSGMQQLAKNMEQVYNIAGQTGDTIKRAIYINTGNPDETFFHLLLDKLNNLQTSDSGENDHGTAISQSLAQIRLRLDELSDKLSAGGAPPDQAQPPRDDW